MVSFIAKTLEVIHDRSISGSYTKRSGLSSFGPIDWMIMIIYRQKDPTINLDRPSIVLHFTSLCFSSTLHFNDHNCIGWHTDLGMTLANKIPAYCFLLGMDLGYPFRPIG